MGTGDGEGAGKHHRAIVGGGIHGAGRVGPVVGGSDDGSERKCAPAFVNFNIWQSAGTRTPASEGLVCTAGNHDLTCAPIKGGGLRNVALRCDGAGGRDGGLVDVDVGERQRASNSQGVGVGDDETSSMATGKRDIIERVGTGW